MKLLLINDHPLFSVCIAHALNHSDADVRVDTALTVEDGLTRAAWGSHDIVLIDERLDGSDGIDALHRFGSHFPLMARVLISSYDDVTLAARAQCAGAHGYLSGSCSIAQLLAALRSIGRGDRVFERSSNELAARPEPGPTARQLQVLALVAQGQPNKRIASALGIAERTVKLHITALLQTLGARNRTHLLIVGRDKGLL